MDQMEREKHDKELEERKILLYEEARKREELLNARKHMRHEEMNELREMQEKRFEELQKGECELEKLRTQEISYNQNIERINDELDKLSTMKEERDRRMSFPRNLRRVKMLLRDRSASIRTDLQDDIKMLKRIPRNHQNESMIETLQENFEMSYDLEIQKKAQIEAMYESEAKEALIKQQEIWSKESKSREKYLRSLLTNQLELMESELNFIRRRRDELVATHESQRKSASDAAERVLKLRKADEEDDDISLAGNDCIGTLCIDVRKQIDLGPVDSNRPKYGRKKIVWT